MGRPIPRRLLWLGGLLAAASVASQVGRWAEIGPWAPAVPAVLMGQPVVDVPAPSCEAFRANLARDAGAPIDPSAVRGAATALFGRLEVALDRAARELDPASGDWRVVFDQLRRDVPSSSAEVLDWYRVELDLAAQFVAAADLMTLPGTPIEVVEVKNAIFEETFPLALYLRGGMLGVITRAGSDPGYLANHCRVCVAPLAVHEGIPGHHLAFSHEGAVAPTTPINPVVHEGWALYAELLMLEQGYWKDQPGRELAALRMVAWRALRATIDAELHCGDLDRATAEERYRRELGMSAEAATIELTRHLLAPGHKASYFVGASQVLALRAVAGSDQRHFHDQLLSNLAPFPEVAVGVFGVELPRFDRAAADLWGM
jgi:uncharacterized protein (DUF885 family)